MVQITLVEAKDILSSFDHRLRAYTERLIRKRKSMNILKASVTGIPSSYLPFHPYPISPLPPHYPPPPLLLHFPLPISSSPFPTPPSPLSPLPFSLSPPPSPLPPHPPHKEVTSNSVTLNDGTVLPCGMVVWSTGLAPRYNWMYCDCAIESMQLVLLPCTL